MKVSAKYPVRVKEINRYWLFLEKEKSRKTVKHNCVTVRSRWCIHIMNPPYSERMSNQKTQKRKAVMIKDSDSSGHD